MMQKTLTINCDGGSRGNPGPAACAFVASEDGNIVYQQSKFLGIATNNEAEYLAVLLALKWLKSFSLINKYSLVNFVLDSELVVKQINKIYKVKNQRLSKFYLEINKLIKELKIKIEFKNVLREKNKKADSLVNIELDKNETL